MARRRDAGGITAWRLPFRQRWEVLGMKHGIKMRTGVKIGGALAFLMLAAGCGSGGSSASSASTTTTVAATTTTVGHTPTSAPPGAGGTVPSLKGEHLDQAEGTLLASSIGYKAFGGGAFGILDAANWTVCSQTPAAGVHAASVGLVVARTCAGT